MKALFSSRKAIYKPGDEFEVDGHPVRLRVHGSATRISLRLDARERLVVATAPSERRLSEAAEFAKTRAEWIAKALKALPQPIRFLPGHLIQVEGAPCRLERAAMRIKPNFKPATADEPARLIAYGVDEAYARAVTRGLKALAEQRLWERTCVHVAALNQPLPELAVTDAKGRWGSCKQAHRGQPAQIRYNWRLILAPPQVLDYVAAHECAHLIEANHGAAFWALNTKLHPQVKTSRAWLKTHGGSLHAAG
jgi:predicted metal-dependent hydrolase